MHNPTESSHKLSGTLIKKVSSRPENKWRWWVLSLYQTPTGYACAVAYHTLRREESNATDIYAERTLEGIESRLANHRFLANIPVDYGFPLKGNMCKRKKDKFAKRRNEIQTQLNEIWNATMSEVLKAS